MFPHPDTETQIARMRRQEALGAAARYRDARDHSGHGEEQGAPRKLRQQVGEVLIRFGRRLQGTHPLEPVGQASKVLAATGTGR